MIRRRRDNSSLWISLRFISVVIFGICVYFSLGSMLLLGASSSRNILIYPQPPFFSPNQLTIKLGTSLTWQNRTQEPHTIVSDDCRFGQQCSFDSGFLRPNAFFTLPPLQSGTYPYHCGIHPFMRGLLTIHRTQSHTFSNI